MDQRIWIQTVMDPQNYVYAHQYGERDTKICIMVEIRRKGDMVK